MGYSTQDIADMIGVKSVTVRKYSAAIETAGYIIERSDHNHRIYSDTDAMMLRQLKTLCDKSGMSVEMCANIVVEQHKRASDSVAPAVSEQSVQLYDKRYVEQVEAYKTIMTNVMQENQAMRQELAELRAIQERQEERQIEQNTQISEVLREILETRRMLAASQEKKSLFKKIFSREPEPHEPDPERAWKVRQEPTSIFKPRRGKK